MVPGGHLPKTRITRKNPSLFASITDMETPEHLWLTQCTQLLEEFELFRAEIAGMRNDMRQGVAEMNAALSGVEHQITKIQ